MAIVIPAIPFTEENRKKLEQGYRYGGEETIREQEVGHEEQ